ncbi:MAG: tail fiber domain-containing protein [Acidobacteriota bacterium]|nr:tail fiber domain-containing protein [Acidobacteriota bacterium]
MRSRTRTRFVVALGLAAASSRGLAQIGAPVAGWTVARAPAAPAARTGKGTMTDLTNPLPFIAVAPCRVVDTRGPAGPYGGPALSAESPRSFVVPAGPCPGIPTTAAAFSLNVTAVAPSGAGFLVVYPQGAAQPLVSTLNYLPGQTLANAAIVAAGPGGGITVMAGTGTHLIIDINGYFAGAVVTRLNPGTGVSLTGSEGVITVGIANGGVGLPQLSAAGSTPGQSLVSTGGAVGWGNPLSFTGLLAGEVTGSQGATVVSSATSSNIANAIVRRDGVGNFSASALSLAGDLTLPANSGSVFQGPSLFLHTSGSESVFLGLSAASFASRGAQDTAVGVLALSANLTGDDNSAFGWASLVANNTGSLNTAVGAFSLANLASGNENTAIGQQALHHTLGSRNIGLGSFAGFNLTTGNDNIELGNTGVAGESNTIRIGTGQTRTFLAGVRGVQTGMADALSVVIDSQGQLGMINSSAAAKREIRDIDAASSAVLSLRPVSFFYRNDEVGIRQYGLVAEEVASVFPELVQFSPSGAPETVRYQFLPPLLLGELQKQSRAIHALEETIDIQRRTIRALESRLTALEGERKAIRSDAALAGQR